MPAPVALPPPVASAEPALTVIADVAREKRRPRKPATTTATNTSAAVSAVEPPLLGGGVRSMRSEARSGGSGIGGARPGQVEGSEARESRPVRATGSRLALQ